MFKKVLFIATVILFFSACHIEAAVINSNWVGGSSNEWGNAANWNPNIVPDNNLTNTFAVTIDAGGDELFVGLQQSRTINQLDCYGEVFLRKWPHYWIELSLVGTNGLTNYGVLEIEELNVNGNITNNPGAYIDILDLVITGNLDNPAGGMIEVEWDCCVIGAVENGGLMVIVPAGELNIDENTLHNTGQVNIYGGECFADEILDNNDTGLIKGFGMFYAKQLVENKGQIIAYGGSLVIASEGPLTNTGVLGNKPLSSLHIKPAEDVNNQGTIEVNASGGIAFDCNLVNEADSVIRLLGGTLAATTITQSADANFAGFGGITGNIEIESGATISLTGPTNIVGDVNIPSGSTLEISDGQTLITGHTTCDGTIRLIGGTVVFQGDCDCEDCEIINEAGIDRNHFDVNANGIVDAHDFAYFANTWLWTATWYE